MYVMRRERNAFLHGPAAFGRGCLGEGIGFLGLLDANDATAHRHTVRVGRTACLFPAKHVQPAALLFPVHHGRARVLCVLFAQPLRMSDDTADQVVVGLCIHHQLLSLVEEVA